MALRVKYRWRMLVSLAGEGEVGLHELHPKYLGFDAFLIFRWLILNSSDEFYLVFMQTLEMEASLTGRFAPVCTKD